MNIIKVIFQSCYDCGLAICQNDDANVKSCKGYCRLDDIPDELDIKSDPKVIGKIFDAQQAIQEAKNNHENRKGAFAKKVSQQGKTNYKNSKGACSKPKNATRTRDESR